MSNISFDKIIDKVFDGFKKITPALVAVAIVSGSILFLPATFLSKLGLNNLPESIKTLIGTLFLLSCALILTILCSVVFQRRIKIAKYKKQIKMLEKQMQKMTEYEKNIIEIMNRMPANILVFSEQQGITGILNSKNIIYQVSTVSCKSYAFMFQYALQPWVIDYINRHKDYFTISDDEFEKNLNSYYKNIGFK